MIKRLGTMMLAAGLAATTLAAQAPAGAAANQEREFLSRVRRLTVEGKRAGEGYWSPDGKRLVFQSEREPGNPFYQIYVLDFATGDTKRISPGMGKTTCAFFRPGTDQILFASTHHDPKSKQYQDDELAFRASGKERRYAWDYDPEMEIYALRREDRRADPPHQRARLRRRGRLLARRPVDRRSRRCATPTTAPCRRQEQKQLATDPSYFGEIYIMKADGSGQTRLTNTPGYDGGPFFTPDGKRIVWRRFDEQGLIADVWTMKLDGTRREADHRLQVDELGALRARVGRVLPVRLEQARLRELRDLHGRQGGREGAGARHLLGWLRRTAGALAGRHADRLHLVALAAAAPGRSSWRSGTTRRR